MTRADLIADEFEGANRAAAEPSPNGNGSHANGRSVNGTNGSNGSHGSSNGAQNGHNGAGRQNGQNTQKGRSGNPELQIDKPAPATAAAAGSASGSGSASSSKVTSSSKAGSRDKVVPAEHHESLPEIAKHAAGAWLRAAGWTAGTSLRVGGQLARIATDPNNAQDVIDDVTREVRGVAREFLGINELDDQIQQIAPLVGSGLLRRGGSSPEALRAQGEELLRAAADVGFDEGAHPAFARILGELSPDEARILRMLAIEGPQPMVDVRATNLIGNGSQLIAQSLNMLGVQSGVRHRERVPVYLSNLVRLNMVVLSEDALGDVSAYQVLEAQPEVLGTLKETPRAKPIRRSILMTPLGQEFCEVCLPLQLPALPPPSREG